MINTFILNVKRRETPFYSAIYNTAKTLRRISFPSIYLIHNPLYTVSRFLIRSRWKLQEALWSVPVFKTKCYSVGKNLRLPNGIPWFEGNNLKIEIDDNVTIYKTNFTSGHAYDEPTLKVGKNTSIGYNTIISINKEVSIGDHVMIAHNCFIADSDGHPIDSQRRLNHEAVQPDEVKSITIGNNVWIGANCVILKGAKIGDNSVISPNSVITGKVLPNKVMMGNPARAAKAL